MKFNNKKFNDLVQKLHKLEANPPPYSIIRQMLKTEYGLTVLNALNQTDPKCLWVLISGYVIHNNALNDTQKKLVANARILLNEFGSMKKWNDTIEFYKQFSNENSQYTAYRWDINQSRFIPQESSHYYLADERTDFNSDLFTAEITYDSAPLNPATPGNYLFKYKSKTWDILIPQINYDQLPKVTIKQGRSNQNSSQISIPFQDLIASATEMDEIERQLNKDLHHWVSRLNHINLKEEPQFTTFNNTLVFDSITHIVGVVNSGKSTLIQIITYWAIKKAKKRVGIVVGDVIGILEIAQTFTDFGVESLPIIGKSMRLDHLKRLDQRVKHRINHSQEELDGNKLPLEKDTNYNWLSATCLIKGFQTDDIKQTSIYPCWNLKSTQKSTENASSNHASYHCPLAPICPQLKQDYATSSADLLLFTPSSLIQTKISPIVDPNEPTYLEFAYDNLDLLMVDEIDRVQIASDNCFAKERHLTGAAEMSIDSIFGLIHSQMVQSRRKNLFGDFAKWKGILNKAHTTLERLVSLVQNHPTNTITKQIKKRYVNPIQLFYELRVKICKEIIPDFDPDIYNNEANDPDIIKILREFVEQSASTFYIPEKMKPYYLEYTQLDNQSDLSQNEFLTLISALPEEIQTAINLFILLRKLDVEMTQLAYTWEDEFAADLNLEINMDELLDRGSVFHQYILPHSPLGRYFGYRFENNKNDDGGELKVVSYRNIGRDIWYEYPKILYGINGRYGPVTLLFSATSYMPLSTKYHYNVKPKYILKATERFQEALANSECSFYPINLGDGNIKISGPSSDIKTRNLKIIANELVRSDLSASNSPKNSRIEKILADLPENRKCILLVVGSYAQAKTLKEAICNCRNDLQSKVQMMIPDRDSDEDMGLGIGFLPRSEIERLSNTETTIFIAPLQAIERGYNILNVDQEALIGAVMFLIRPMPHPDDYATNIYQLNQWAIEYLHSLSNLTCLENLVWNNVSDLPLGAIGSEFRKEAHSLWSKLSNKGIGYSALTPRERQTFLADSFILVWQVVGRTIRGDVPTKVFFVDGSFKPVPENDIKLNMLDGLQSLLNLAEDNADKILIELYRPFFNLLNRMTGV